MFIDSGKITPMQGKEPPVMTTRGELKKDAVRKKWKILISKSWRRIEKNGQTKRARAANP